MTLFKFSFSKSKVVYILSFFSPLFFKNIQFFSKLWRAFSFSLFHLYVYNYIFSICYIKLLVFHNFCSLLASLLLPKLKHFSNRLKCLSIKYRKAYKHGIYSHERGATHNNNNNKNGESGWTRKRKQAHKQFVKKRDLCLYIVLYVYIRMS